MNDSAGPAGAGAPLLSRLAEPGPQVTVELRPPRSGLAFQASMNVWIDMHHSVRGLTRAGRTVFLTDNAVGAAEEENLLHLSGNLPDGTEPTQVVPFLTCKHSMDYCLRYAERAQAAGFGALTVLGGDRFAGPPRCVPHAYLLRQRIREHVPSLALGGWVNPHRPADEQVGYVARPDYTAEFALTQVVSHHSLPAVEALLTEADLRGIRLPMVFGVFLYRSANPRTLERLQGYFPVPAEELTREFDEGATAEEVCARSIRALREAGAEKVYVSNLGFARVGATLKRILALV